MQAPLSAFDEAKVPVHADQHDATALYNLLAYELRDELAEAGRKSDAVLVALDVGRESTNYVAAAPGAYWFRSIPLGGERFTRLLVRAMRLTLTEAEQLKRAPWKARSMQQWDEALDPVIRSFLEEVRRSEKALGSNRCIARLYLAGGGAQLHGLLHRLAQAAGDRP